LGPLQYRKEIIVGSEGYLITISCVRSISFVSLILLGICFLGEVIEGAFMGW